MLEIYWKKADGGFARIRYRGTHLDEMHDLNCPICGKALTSDEYNHATQELKEQMSKTQPVLKREVGEQKLLEDLRETFPEDQLSRQTSGINEGALYIELIQAFPDDFFRRLKRGSYGIDVIQRIRTTTGIIDTPIIYYNKETDTITEQDIVKAVSDKKVRATDYVIITSSNLPKQEVGNGLYGEKDGILLVHPSILVAVAKTIREGIIRIDRESKSKEDGEFEQAKLNYIKGQDLNRLFSALSELHTHMFEFQSLDETYHRISWDARRLMRKKLAKISTNIANSCKEFMQKTDAEDFLL
jgi:hypothetical protein